MFKFPPIRFVKKAVSKSVSFSDEQKAEEVAAVAPAAVEETNKRKRGDDDDGDEDHVAKRKANDEEPRKNRKVKTQFVRSKERAMSSYFQRVYIKDSIFMPRDDIGRQMGLSTRDEDILYDFGNCPVWDTHSDYRSCGHVKRTVLDDKENLSGDVVIYSPSQVPYEQRERQSVLIGEIVNGSIKQFSVSFFRIEDSDTKKNHIYPVEISVCREGRLDVGNYGKVEFSAVDPPAGTAGVFSFLLTHFHLSFSLHFFFLSPKVPNGGKRKSYYKTSCWFLSSTLATSLPQSQRIEREENEILKRYCTETGTPESRCTVKRIRMSSEFAKVEEKVKKEDNSAAPAAPTKKEENAAAAKEDVVMEGDDDTMHYNEDGEYVSKFSAEDNLRTAFLFGESQYADFFALKKQVKPELYSKLEQVVDSRIETLIGFTEAEKKAEADAELAPLLAKFTSDLKALKVPVAEKEPAAVLEMAYKIIKKGTVEKQAANAEKFSKNVVGLFSAPAPKKAEVAGEASRSKNARAREEEEEEEADPKGKGKVDEAAETGLPANYEAPMQRLMRLTRDNKKYVSQTQLAQGAGVEKPPAKFASPEQKQRYNHQKTIEGLFVSSKVSQRFGNTKEVIDNSLRMPA